MRDHKSVVVIPVRGGIADTGLGSLLAGPGIDLHVAADVTKGKSGVSKSPGLFSVAHHVVESAPETKRRKAVIEIVHRNPVHERTEMIVVVSADPEANGAEIESGGGVEWIAAGTEQRRGAGAAAITQVVVVGGDHGNIVEYAILQLLHEGGVDFRDRRIFLGMKGKQAGTE